MSYGAELGDAFQQAASSFTDYQKHKRRSLHLV
jgi:hypothetical protein